MFYICSLPNPGVDGTPKELFTDEPSLIERFAKAENRPGRGVYDCIGKLKDGARSRCKDNVVELDKVVVDLDLKNIVEPRDEVIKVPRGLLLSPSEIRDSGFGLHAVWRFKEAVTDAAGLEQAERIMVRLAELLAGDPAPTHRAALLRHPGCDNTKSGEPRKCHAIEQTEQQYDISEFEDMFDLYGDRPQLTGKPKPATNGHDHTAEGERKGPVDVEAEFASICDGASANAAQCRVIPKLLRSAVHPNEVHACVVDGTMAAPNRPVSWTRETEVRIVRHRILSTLRNLFLADYDHTTGLIPDWLPAEFHAPWIARLEAGRIPDIGFNPGGFYVRSKEQAEDRQPRKKKDHAREDTGEQPKAEQAKAKQSSAEQAKGQPKATGWLYYDTTKPTPVEWLIKGILPKTGVAILSGQWGSYKTTIAEDISISVMTKIPFADKFRVKRQGAVLYFATEGAGTLQSRLAALAKERSAPEKLPFAWRSDCPPLSDKNAAATICAFVDEASAHFQRTYGFPVTVVWFDTWSQTAGLESGEDNDTAAVGKALKVLRVVSAHAGAVCVAVDHFGKVLEAGTRGSSAKEGNTDTVLASLAEREVSGGLSNTRLAVRKQRDGLAGFEVTFTPLVNETGVDEDGDPQTSVTIEWGKQQVSAKVSKWTKGLKLLQQSLKTVLANRGFPLLLPDGSTTEVARFEDVRTEFCAQFVIEDEDENVTDRQKLNTKRHAFSRALKDAQGRKLVRIRETDSGDVIWFAT